MSIEQIELWHKRARPKPTDEDFSVQLGCHFEEIEEMMSAIVTDDDDIWETMRSEIFIVATMLKEGRLKAKVADRKELLDSIADQIVTAVGAGYCAGMKTSNAVAAVNRSNYSKFDKDGMPIFNEHGKVTKGPDYTPPNLEGMY
jgi:predicted HAD superfamily Cof-like phosphohydrolase